MIGEIISYGLSSYLGNKATQNQRDYGEMYRRLARQYRNNRLASASNLFNRRYYTNYLDTPTAQNMLKQVREQLGDQSRAMRNQRVVTGATGESLAALQKNNNRVMDSAVGTLATADMNMKERALQDYAQAREKADDMMFKVELDGVMRENVQQNKSDENNRNYLIGLLDKMFEELKRKAQNKQNVLTEEYGELEPMG
ncbi:MAG: hypothetical protein IJE18_02065 [Bacteroidaceae bacterium]|nr:hypothetical protein [Bacteroidaceae bacterium]